MLNVANGRSVDLLTLLGLLNRLLGMSVQPMHDPPRPGDVRESMADIAAARNLLGYEPQVEFRGRAAPLDRVLSADRAAVIAGELRGLSPSAGYRSRSMADRGKTLVTVATYNEIENLPAAGRGDLPLPSRRRRSW